LREDDSDRVAPGLRLQFEALAERREAGDRLIGWKVGLNAAPVQQHLGIVRPVLGHLTTASVIEPGSTHSLAGGVRVGVEPEVAIHLGAAGTIASLGPAIEVVDLDPELTELESILAGNVFHRGVVLGPALEDFDPAGLDTLTATVRKNGSVVESAPFSDTGEAPADVVKLIAERLALVGEELAEGQVIIAGSLTPIVFVGAGDAIEVDLGPLGSLQLGLA
jgi:2-oxo-hept-3-ene-1,7-dioate hydratase